VLAVTETKTFIFLPYAWFVFWYVFCTVLKHTTDKISILRAPGAHGHGHLRNVEDVLDTWYVWKHIMFPFLNSHSWEINTVFQSSWVQSGFEHLQGWRLHSLPGQLVLMFDHSHSKKFFLGLNGLSCVYCFSFSLGFCSLAPSSLFPHIKYLHTVIRPRRAFSCPGWTVPDLSAFPCMRDAPVP